MPFLCLANLGRVPLGVLPNLDELLFRFFLASVPFAVCLADNFVDLVDLLSDQQFPLKLDLFRQSFCIPLQDAADSLPCDAETLGDCGLSPSPPGQPKDFLYSLLSHNDPP